MVSHCQPIYVRELVGQGKKGKEDEESEKLIRLK
jgi:hypothetical protein